jgi:hypothetical protein
MQKEFLVGRVISYAFPLYSINTTHWITQSLWYWGLSYAMVALPTAGVDSVGLQRLACHPQWHEKLQGPLKRPVNGEFGLWSLRLLRPMMWQTPNFMLGYLSHLS